MIFEKIRKFYPFYILIIGLAIYFKTSAFEVTAGDSGELLTASYFLGTGHPPGYPLYYILAKLFSYLFLPFQYLISIFNTAPIDNFAFAVNFLSGIFTTLTMLTLYYSLNSIIEHIYSNEFNNKFLQYKNEVSLITSLILGLTNLIWSQSTNSEVYTLNMFLLTLNFSILIKFGLTKNLKFLKLFSFLYGLNIVAHQSALVFSPIFILWILLNKPDIIKNLRILTIMFLLFLLGLSVYFYMPIRSFANPAIDWGETSNLKNFFYHILRKQYGKLVSESQTETILQAKRNLLNFLKQLFVILKITYQNLSLPVTILILPAFYELFKKKRKLFLFLIASIIFYTLTTTYITNFKISKLSIYVNQVFYIPVILLFIFILPFGIIYIISKSSISNLKYFFILPILLFLINFHLNDKSKNYIISEYTKNILKTATKDSFLFVMGDNTTFPLAYYLYVKKLRPDIIPVEEYGFIFQEIFKYAKIKFPVPNDLKKRIRDKIEDILLEKATNEIFYTYEVQKKLQDNKKIVPYGIIYKLIKSETEKRIDNYTFFSYDFTSMDDKKIYQDLMDRDMASIVYYHIGEYLNSIGETILASKYSLKSKFVSGTEYAKQRIHYNLAMDYKNKGEYEKAIKELLEAIEIDPKYSRAYSLLGNIYSDLGKPYQAIEAFKKAIENDPQNSKSYNNLGVELYKIGKKIEAFESFKKAIELDSNNYEAYNNIAVILEDFKKYNEAVQMYKKAISLNPNYKDAYYNLGTLYLNANYLDESLKLLNEAIRIYPQYADAYYNIGILFQKKREYYKAIPYFEKASFYKKNFAESYFNIGVCYLWLKNYHQAEIYFKKSIEIKPDYYLAYKHLGNTYYYLNNLSKAYKEWEKAFKLNPADKELENNLNVLKSQGIQ